MTRQGKLEIFPSSWGKWEVEFGLLDHSKRKHAEEIDGKNFTRDKMLDLPHQDFCLHNVLISEWDSCIFIQLAKEIVMFMAGERQGKGLST